MTAGFNIAMPRVMHLVADGKRTRVYPETLLKKTRELGQGGTVRVDLEVQSESTSRLKAIAALLTVPAALAIATKDQTK